MAQLAATEQALYYPTDIRVVELFVRNHVQFSSSSFTAYDPCSGEGLALKTFASSAPGYSKIITIGSELEKERAKAGKENLTKSIHAAFETLEFDGQPGLIWLNPPYDSVGGIRTELTWITMVAPLLENGRCMILVLPERFMKGHENYNALRFCLYKNNLRLLRPSWDKPLGAFKFPEPEFQQFKQYILVVEKRNRDTQMEKEIPIAGVIGSCKAKAEITTRDNYTKEMPKFEIAVRRGKLVPSVVTKENITKIFGKPSSTIPITPLQPMIDEILAAVIAGGMFSGIEVNNTVVRGGIKIETIKEEKLSEDGMSRETIETQKMTASVVELSLETGEIVRYTSDQLEFGERIEAIAKAVRDVMKTEAPSIYQEADLEKYLPRYADIHAPRSIKGHINGLFAPQQRAVAMLLKGWETQKSTILLGKMGTGKTIVSIAATVAQIRNRAQDMQKIVVLLPSKNDLVRKWKEEIARSCKDLKPSIFDIENITQTKEAFANPGLTFILVKESMVKRTSGWEHMSRVEHSHTAKTCWKCGKKNQLVTSEGELPEKDGLVLYCDQCGASYKTDVRDRNDNAYSSLARYINKHYAKSYVLIADEAHTFKGGDSARGYASGSLIRGAWRVLCMTGTFYNGYASSMFFTLYRTQGSFRETTNYDDVQAFIQLYGLEQKITRQIKREGQYSWSGYNVKNSTRVKEIPGIHPAMIALMLPYTIFMKIEDFGKPEYDKAEFTLFTDLEKSTEKKITSYLEAIKQDAVNQMKSDGSMSLMSQLTWAKAAVYDVYPLGDTVDGHGLPPINPTILAPKEEALLRLVQWTKKEGYPSLIFYVQTDRRPIYNRLADWFAKYGMKLSYMPSTVNKRIEFIDGALAHGADAVLCNPNLVREGIDLLQFGAIVWYGVTPDAILVDQANARIYRPLIQNHNVKMFYLGYNGTYQSEQWTTTAKKVAAMSAVHGDIRKGLAALLGEDTLITTVQDQLIQYKRVDSQLTMADLPVLEVWETKIQEEATILEDAIDVTDEWSPKEYDNENAIQLSMF